MTTRSRKALVLASAAVVLLGGITAVRSRAEESPYKWAAGLPGCDISRPAVAHHPDQQVLASQPANGPVPCGMLTGWPTVENKIEVTNGGAVFYEPALGGGPILSGDGRGLGLQDGTRFARTFDNGAKWSASSVQVAQPPTPEGGSHAQQDNNIYVDHDTNRLFWYVYTSGYAVPPACSNGASATVLYSDDNGSTWTWGFDQDHDCAENPTILTGALRLPGEQMSYPNVVYLCGDNTSSGVGGTGTAGYSCSKSLDGGAHWLGTTLKGQGFYSGLAKDMLHPYSQCAGQSSSAGADVQRLPNGTLVVVVSCNSHTFLSMSTDEGATWTIANEIPHGGVLRIDSAGNMYLAETAKGGADIPVGEPSSGSSALLLSHSTDGGVTWSPEMNIVGPGVDSVGTWSFAQGTQAPMIVGQVAVTYYGIRHGQTTSDGFITATRDALDANPLLWSGQVNNPNRPLLYNTPTDLNAGITVEDFNGGAWAPDGQSVWGSWVQDCGANILTGPNCQSRLPSHAPTNPTDGFAGRLVWPSGGGG